MTVNSIVLELQKDALDANISIVQLLRKALLISRKLNLKDFEKWINYELNGYPNVDEIPDYRKVTGEIKAYNPFNGVWMPIFFESAEEAKLLSKRMINQKITELEMLEKKDKHSQLHVSFTKEAETRLVSQLGLPSKPVLIVPSTSVHGIIESVRNIIIDWTMKLEEKGILGENLTFSQQEKDTAVSSTQINITNFQGILGDVSNSVVNQSNKLKIIQNDFESLRKHLINELKIPKEDVDELEIAVKEDGHLDNSGKFGSKVSSWLGKMVSKAASGLISLSINTAANVLGQAISVYYGINAN